jgi:uncharacterized membrane protein YtjA (UPF0391 family)
LQDGRATTGTEDRQGASPEVDPQASYSIADEILCAPARLLSTKKRRVRMLRLALFFLVVAIVAGLFGFSGIAAASAGIAKILFFLFVVVFLILLIAGLMAGSALF